MPQDPADFQKPIHEAVIDVWKRLAESGINIILARPDKPWTEEEMLASGKPVVADIMRQAEQLGMTGNRAVLDFGCGIGRLAEHFVGHFHTVVGVEPADAFRRIARKQERSSGPIYFSHVPTDLRYWLKFDLIVVNLVFIHHELSSIAADLWTLQELLADDGLLRCDLYVTDDLEVAAADDMNIRLNAANAKQSVVGAVYRPELEKRLAAIGLQIVHSDSRSEEHRCYEILWLKKVLA